MSEIAPSYWKYIDKKTGKLKKDAPASAKKAYEKRQAERKKNNKKEIDT